MWGENKHTLSTSTIITRAMSNQVLLMIRSRSVAVSLKAEHLAVWCFRALRYVSTLCQKKNCKKKQNKTKALCL